MEALNCNFDTIATIREQLRHWAPAPYVRESTIPYEFVYRAL
jgi:hypothetical protein